MTDKANITISLPVDLTRLGALIALLTKSEPAEAVAEVAVEQPAEVVAEVVVEQPAEAVAEAVAEVVVEQPAEAVAEVVAEQPAEVVAEQPAEIDYYQLCEDIATKLRVMAKDGRRKEAKDIMSRYKVTALSKLNALAEDKIVELFNELREY